MLDETVKSLGNLIDGLDSETNTMQQKMAYLQSLSTFEQCKVLYTTTFLCKYSKFKSFDEIVECFKLKPDGTADDNLDNLVKQNTNFDNWKELDETALARYLDADNKLVKF